MKIVIVGGGAHRVLGILRSVLAVPGVMEGGEIDLFDLNRTRAEAMGRMLLKSPEGRACDCTIKWSHSLEEALPGADVVGVILPAITPSAYWDSTDICHRHGFISSDNVSPTGALCGVRIAGTILGLARKMEQHCPAAWLINFVNPAGVLSGMLNKHTSIQTLGVCAGFTNHLWDISRIFGRDEEATGLEVTAAGINHLSYILEGTWNGGDLFDELNRTVTVDWQGGELQPWWDEGSRENIRRSVARLVKIWQELGVLIFSSEGDGMAHLYYEEAVDDERRARKESAPDALMNQQALDRSKAEAAFRSVVNSELDTTFWNEHWKIDPVFKRADEDIFVRIFSALAGVREIRVATSRLNQGAIAGIKDDHVVEYTHRMKGGVITHDGPYQIPDAVHGFTAAMAAHQTLLGDALAEEDPRKLAQALMAYPINPWSRASRAVFRELLELHAESISPSYLKATEYL